MPSFCACCSLLDQRIKLRQNATKWEALMAQVFKREWQNKDGTISSRWVAEYFDNEGHRTYKAFVKKSVAEAYLVTVRGEIASGRHVAPRQSITVGQAAENWIKRVEA